MKRILVAASLVIASALASAQSVESLLLQLDAVVHDKEIYTRNKEERIAAIRSSLSGISDQGRYGIYDALYHENAKYNLDSALCYAQKKAALAAAEGLEFQRDESLLQLAGIYTNAGMYQEAKALVNKVSLRNATYYHTLHTLYSAMAATTVFREQAEGYALLKERYRDSLIMGLPANDLGSVYATSEKMNADGRYYDAILLLTNQYNDPLTQESDKAILDYCMAVAYKGLHNREKAKWHYAKSAIADLSIPIKEYRSLQELSYMLYEDGNLSRAYRYISCAMEDVQASSTMIRTLEFAPSLATIGEAYEKDIRHRNAVQQRLVWLLTGVLALLALVAMFAFRQRNATRRANRKLVEVNEQLVDISKKLQETGCLKDEYLYQYMEQAAASIDQLEAFKRKIQIECRKQGAEKLAASLEASYDGDKQLRSFYRSFDETFLHLFPTFVEDVNNLLKSGQKLEPKPGRLLNTELRILALIRLGVTDNVKMSHFLRTSLSTVYNYRSKLRNAAITDPGAFEDRVAGIGEIKLTDN